MKNFSRSEQIDLAAINGGSHLQKQTIDFSIVFVLPLCGRMGINMNIVIVGAGKVGYAIAKGLAKRDMT